MDYTITGNYVLPSLGKVYSNEIDPNVTLRTMTTAEEMRRMSSTDYPYRLMSEIIKDCMVSGPDLHPYDMCLGDYLFLLYKLRTVTYGSEYTISTICPYCTNNNTDTINLDNLEVKTFEEDILKYQEFILPTTKKKIKIKFQTPRILDYIDERVKQHKKKSNDKTVNPEIIYTLSSMIDKIDDKVVNVSDIENWVRTLPMLDTQTILVYADRLNNSIGIGRGLEVECDLCKLTYSSTFRLSNEFFRPNLDI